MAATRHLCWAQESYGTWLLIQHPEQAYKTVIPATAAAKDVTGFRNAHPAQCTGSVPERNASCFTSAVQYEWRPSGQPAMVAGNGSTAKHSFCHAIRRHGYERLLFFGDSIMRNQANSMWALLGLFPFSTFSSRGSKRLRCTSPALGHQEVPIDLEVPPPAGQLRRIFASWLAAGAPPETPTGLPPGMRINQSNESERSELDWHQSAKRLWDALGDAHTLTVFNLGAHYPRATTTTSSGESYTSFIHDILAVKAAVHHQRAADRFVYRTSPTGHPGCEQSRTPAQPAEGAQDAVYESIAHMWLGCPTCEGVVFNEYGWHQFGAYDRAARDILLPLGVSVLDVTMLSVLRPDAHTAYRHGGGRLPPDCFHWALPGVPDVWNLMLIGALMRCDV